MVNPFESVEQRLLTIEQLLNELLTGKNQPVKKKEEDRIEAPEAAKLLHLGIDRLYSIHSKILKQTKRPNGRLLFSRKEIMEYIESKGVRSIAREVDEAEDYRISKMKKRVA